MSAIVRLSGVSQVCLSSSSSLSLLSSIIQSEPEILRLVSFNPID